jgi:Gas vesicle protein
MVGVTDATRVVEPVRTGRDVALVDLLDRLLADGAVLTGDITLAIADVDLVHISLRALITSIAERRP